MVIKTEKLYGFLTRMLNSNEASTASKPPQKVIPNKNNGSLEWNKVTLKRKNNSPGDNRKSKQSVIDDYWLKTSNTYAILDENEKKTKTRKIQ